MIAVFSCDDSSTHTCWKACFRSTLLNTVHPASCSLKVVSAGNVYLSSLVIAFTRRKSPQTRQEPSGFLTAWIGEAQFDSHDRDLSQELQKSAKKPRMSYCPPETLPSCSDLWDSVFVDQRCSVCLLHLERSPCRELDGPRQPNHVMGTRLAEEDESCISATEGTTALFVCSG